MPRRLGNKGFSLTEMMFAMTILAVGLLALAQMQMMAMRGTTSAREFSKASKIAREGTERFKITGVMVLEGNYTFVKDADLRDWNESNVGAQIAPVINSTTDVSSLEYDVLEVFVEDPDNPMSLVEPDCGPVYHSIGTPCDLTGDWDFVRISNYKNWPDPSTDEQVVMKEINIIVLWKERGKTRSVSMRTLVGRKDSAFF